MTIINHALASHIPDRCEPAPTCSVTTCGNPSATVDLYSGRRCLLHAPRFDGAVAVLLMRAEGARAALTYLRGWIQ